jgi:rhamnosyltransferase subunit B
MPPWLLRALFRLSDAWGAREILGPLNEHRAALHLRPLPSFEALVRDADAIAALFPAWLAPIQPDWPPQLTQFGFPWPPTESAPLDATVERFLQHGEAPIVWTHGSANVDVERFVTAARDATRALGTRGIFVGPGSDANDDFIAIPHAPFERLLPRCRAIVHHAGIGTAMHAFAAGIPQLLVPRAHDQFDNAWRVARTGVGTRMRYASFDGARAARALQALLGSAEARAACERTRELMRGNDPLAALCALAEAVAQGNVAAGHSPPYSST